MFRKAFLAFATPEQMLTNPLPTETCITVIAMPLDVTRCFQTYKVSCSASGGGVSEVLTEEAGTGVGDNYLAGFHARAVAWGPAGFA